MHGGAPAEEGPAGAGAGGSGDDGDDTDEEKAFGERCDAQVGVLEAPAYQLHRRYFPSKVGGLPAWMNPRDLPDAADMACGACGEPLAFLLQLYAPLGDGGAAFHRSLMLFVCRTDGCETAVALRCQMGRHNPFHSSEPVHPPGGDEEGDEEGDGPEAVEQLPDEPWDGVPTCAVCGCRGGMRCGKCKAANYCGKRHQVLAWKAGHSASCGGASPDAAAAEAQRGVVFPCYEVLIDDEEDEGSDCEEDGGAPDGGGGAAQLKNELKEGEEQLWKSFARKEDPYFERFRERVARLPRQVVRYAVDGAGPLWVDTAGRAGEGDVPPCGACGGPRRFEFQALPQLLYYLRAGKLDWGTLAVYTCAASCGGDDAAYRREFVWRQRMPA